MIISLSGVRLGRVFAVGTVSFVISFLLVFAVITAYAFILGFQARGRPDQVEIQRFAGTVAPWLGPAVAVVLTLCGAHWLARRVADRRTLHGLLVGVLVGTLVFVLEAAGGVSVVDVITLVALVAAGYVGGAIADGRSQ